MRASIILKEEFGLESRVINMHTVKPIDRDAIINSVNETGFVLTVEEHQVGGFGNIVAGIIAENTGIETGFKFAMSGINDRFGDSGQPWELMKLFGLTAEFIAKRALKLLDYKE